MKKIMSSQELCDKAIDVAKNYKTLYVMGCFGSPMNAKNKQRYKNNNAYNRQEKRQKMIDNATDDTFGFDCVCLIKGLCWNWCGNKNKTYGGAIYESNGLPDISIATMTNNKYAYDQSKDFSTIQKGELVYIGNSHIGIYIGDGLAVECTPAWKNKVQITAVGNIGKKEGYNTRKWDMHCKVHFIDYSEEPQTEWTPAIYELLYNKCLRKTHKITPTNIVQAKNCDAETKKHLVSQTGNAKLKAGTNIRCKTIYNENGRIWGSYGNCFICLRNINGVAQARKIKDL